MLAFYIDITQLFDQRDAVQIKFDIGLQRHGCLEPLSSAEAVLHGAIFRDGFPRNGPALLLPIALGLIPKNNRRNASMTASPSKYRKRRHLLGRVKVVAGMPTEEQRTD